MKFIRNNTDIAMMVQGYGAAMMDRSDFSLTMWGKVAERTGKVEKWSVCVGQFGFFGFEGR